MKKGRSKRGFKGGRRAKETGKKNLRRGEGTRKENTHTNQLTNLIFLCHSNS